MANEHGWKFKVEFTEGRVAEVIWEEYFYEGKSSGYWIDIVDPNTGEKPVWDDVFSEKAVRQAATTFRAIQVRNTLKKPKMGFATDEWLKARTLELFHRSEAGEYMGQYVNSNFYVQEAAAILDVPMKRLLPVVQQLIDEGELGLHGMIFIPFEQYEAAFASWLEKTGHKRFSASDFGYWGCRACGAHGDPEDNPRLVPCTSD